MASDGDGIYDHTVRVAGVDIVRHGAFCLPSDDTAALEAVSREVAQELASYPPRLLASAHLARVTLCARIDNLGIGDALGLADVVEDRVLLDIHADVAEILPHELFHLVDMNMQYDNAPAFDAFDLAWRLTSPHGASDGAPVTHGFVNPYATTNAYEDRASTFEYLIARAPAACALAREDVVIRRKVTLIWRRMTEMLGSDAFLVERAPCVAELLRGDGHS
jgi:hypothetical protein